MKLIVIYPKRGRPPCCPPGYIPEPGDPFICHKIWVSCLFHGIASCGRHICALKGIEINQNVCESCRERVAPDTFTSSNG